jgi:hypothetical protein
MKLIEITDSENLTCLINPRYISSIFWRESSGHTVIYMADGISHDVPYTVDDVIAYLSDPDYVEIPLCSKEERPESHEKIRKS